MKKFFLLAIVCFNLSLYAQSEIRITSKKCIPKKGYYLQLKSILKDSRCPEDVTCIWAGEVSVLVKVYNNEEFVEEKTLTFNSKYTEENNLWFSRYYLHGIKSVEVLPYPKTSVVMKPGENYIKIEFK